MRILILSPHPDDAELCMGGTISRLKREGNFIKVISFSNCENSFIGAEFVKSMELLKVDEYDFLHYPRRKFKIYRQDFLDILIKETDFDMVFSPPPYDCHQDHQTIAEEAIRAYKKSSLLFYINPNNSNQINIRLLYKLELSDILNKEAALSCYNSQFEMKRSYFDPYYQRCVSRVFGEMTGTEYAEGFDIYREIR